MTDRKHNHYFRESGYEYIDVYRVLELFNVTDPCLQHIAKKALCAGLRGHKNLDRDIQDIIDTATRKLEMMNEQPHRSNETGVLQEPNPNR